MEGKENLKREMEEVIAKDLVMLYQLEHYINVIVEVTNKKIEKFPEKIKTHINTYLRTWILRFYNECMDTGLKERSALNNYILRHLESEMKKVIKEYENNIEDTEFK